MDFSLSRELLDCNGGHFQWYWDEVSRPLNDLVTSPGIWRWVLEKNGVEALSKQFLVLP